MSILHTESVDQLLSLTALERDEVLEEMEAYADRNGFPTIGHEVGGFLRLCARLGEMDTVFECGSGFGYSAYWVAPVLGPDGQIVLTDGDEELLSRAETYFENGGYADRAAFEQGDALEIFDRYDGPFDMVLLDHENDRYVEGFETVRDRVEPGGMIVADNVLHTNPPDERMTPADLAAALEDGVPEDAGYSLTEFVDYYEHVRADPDFETTVVPVGEGLFVSIRTQ
ncbi:O-methyltransferase (plasmid) [Natrialbaceae archaeon A-arb3/5]